MHKPALVFGSIFAALAVILGAFGAHALKEVLSESQLQTFETGVRYQFYHSIALLFTGLVHQHLPVKSVRVSSTLFITGIILFSGSLYALTMMKMTGQVGLGGLGILTPIGGVFFIAGWLTMCISFFQKK